MLDRMKAGVLGGARANRTKVLIVPMLAGRPLEVTVEQSTHDELIVRNVPIGVQPKDMGLARVVLVGDGEVGVHGIP